MRVIILYKRFTRRALPFGFIQTKASPFFHGRRSLCSRLSRLPRLIVSPKWSVFRRFVLTQVLEWDFLKWSSVCLAAVAGVSDRKRRGVLAFIARFFRFPLCLLSVLFLCVCFACLRVQMLTFRRCQMRDPDSEPSSSHVAPKGMLFGWRQSGVRVATNVSSYVLVISLWRPSRFAPCAPNVRD